jgi:thioredoxin-like negative regulator of GroEL
VRAKIAAGRGEHKYAETLAEEAVALAETTQSLLFRADARAALAEVLVAAGQARRATSELELAAALYKSKGTPTSLERVQRRIRELAEPTFPSS